MDSLPEDIQRYIRSFITVISWRAEEHFFKLLHRYRTVTFEQLPENAPVHCIEYHDHYIYQHKHGYYIRVNKSDNLEVENMKHLCCSKYTEPLRLYLSNYRKHYIHLAWSLTSSFQLFGIHVECTMSPNLYTHFLWYQATQEGMKNEPSWQGCLPLESYKRACTEYRIPMI